MNTQRNRFLYVAGTVAAFIIVWFAVNFVAVKAR